METVTTSAAARQLGVTRGRIQQLVQAGRLYGEKWGRDWQVSIESIVAYRQSRRRYVKKHKQGV